MNELFSLQGKVVLITGGSRGLGKAMALAFGKAGADVAIVSRKIEACDEVAAQISALGRKAYAVACHVGHWNELEVMVNDVFRHFGRVDILVNNAGMSPVVPSLADLSETLFDKVIAVNLKAPTRLTALVAPRMGQHGGGSIINISSVAAIKPNPMTTAYSAAKAGLNALTKASALEYAASNVRVNAIICGTFKTDITAGFTSNEEIMKEVVKTIAMKRIGLPDEIVGTAVYLASAASSYTTGECIVVDGGIIA